MRILRYLGLQVQLHFDIWIYFSELIPNSGADASLLLTKSKGVEDI